MSIITASQSVTLVKYPGVKNDNLLAPGQRLKVLFLTSLRDVALIDRNGEYVETVDGKSYMEGAIEWITREIKKNERVREILEIVGVVYDDMELPLGKIRLRAGGSAGGHNGIKSIVQAVGSQDFPRLRIGIGRPPADSDPIEYVLGAPADEDREAAAGAIELAVSALASVVADGLDVAMNRFN